MLSTHIHSKEKKKGRKKKTEKKNKNKGKVSVIKGLVILCTSAWPPAELQTTLLCYLPTRAEHFFCAINSIRSVLRTEPRAPGMVGKYSTTYHQS